MMMQYNRKRSIEMNPEFKKNANDILQNYD